MSTNYSALKGKNVLVVGMPGTGKTTLTRYLNSCGVTAAFDADEVPELSGFFDKSGNEVEPKSLSPEDLEGLEWNWDKNVLKTLLETNNGIILFGSSNNWENFTHLFHKIFVLYIDGEETRRRLLSPDRDNEYGRDEILREQIVKDIPNYVEFCIGFGAIQINAHQKTEQIVQNILDLLI